MPTVKLTPSFVRSLHGTAGDRKVNYFDIEQRGFLLEVRPSGGKTYYQRYVRAPGDRDQAFRLIATSHSD